MKLEKELQVLYEKPGRKREPREARVSRKNSSNCQTMQRSSKKRTGGYPQEGFEPAIIVEQDQKTKKSCGEGPTVEWCCEELTGPGERSWACFLRLL